MESYILGVIVGVAFLLLAVLSATLIKFEGGARPKDPMNRKLWFWFLLFAAVAGNFLYNLFVTAPTIAPNLQSHFTIANVISSVVVLATYVIVGFILFKIFPTGKLGNWFSFNK